MSGAQQPPQGYGYPQPPQGYGPPPGYGYGAPPPPGGSRLSPGVIVAVFVGVLLAFALVAGLYVFVSQPPPPIPPCLPGEPCAPRPTLPPVADRSPLPSFSPQPSTQPTGSLTPSPSSSPSGSAVPTTGPQPTPTPGTDSPAAVSGQTWTSSALGYSFEYDPEIFALSDEDEDTAVFNGTFFDAQIVVEASDASSSPAEMITRQLGVVDNFIIARVPDTDEYDALLGPSIGYVRGEGAVFGGTLLGRDGTPVSPAGVVVLASTDGRITVAVVVIVATPDTRIGSETHLHSVRDAADDFLKTFNWGTP